MKYLGKLSPVLWVGLVVVVITGSWLWYQQSTKSESQNAAIEDSKLANQDELETATPTATPTPEVATSATRLTDEGLVWTTPKKVGDLGLIVVNDSDVIGAVTYYEVGTYMGDTLVRAEVENYGMDTYIDWVLFIMKDANYERVDSYNEYYADVFEDLEVAGTKVYSDKVTRNLQKTFASVMPPSGLVVGGGSLFRADTSRVAYTKKIQSYDKVVDWQESQWGPIRIMSVQNDDGTNLELFVMELSDGSGALYAPQSPPTFFKDDYVPTITWNDGKENADIYRVDGNYTCGSPNARSVLDTPSLTGWTKTGTASTGAAIYEPTDPNNTIAKKWYEASGGTRYNTVTEQNETFTYETFLAHHPIAVYQDEFGRLVVMRNTDYGLQAECGKPVVYLYPEKTTQVQVSVGANFHRTIPAYNQGWNVKAEPNGKLTAIDGTTYPYLYWSGIGKGYYPAITTGTVVAQADVQSTLRQQLVQLGLTAQEQADFLEFWSPRMPKTPYVRLTWLGNRAMDQLAPMQISPKPDTVIRLFLDFVGLQEPITIPAQKLTAIPRKGFTVVEWGGLLTGPEVSRP